MDPAGESPARQRLATSRKRVLRAAAGQPVPRSVDSARASRVIEPRKELIEGARVVVKAPAASERRYGLGVEIPPGSESAAYMLGTIEEPGRPHRFRGGEAGGATSDQRPRLTAADARRCGSDRGRPPRYCQARQRVRRERGWGVGAPWYYL